ncbi:DUF1850 domain-containing protein [Sedimentibacter sp.]|uniref:DUF1850 domain-containing protein n=1 Tax=Sedimentibacter sp. TaxID=1960295 RepID=UPI0028ABFAEB|nr:DUF1850 domain-containing protein [Sedimentibacter sp.]
MKNKIFIVSFFVLLAIIFLFVPLIEQFTISNGNTNKIVYIGSVDDFRYFHISFLHSVNRTPVNEFYKIDKNKFIVYKTTFYSYGAGMEGGTLKDGVVEINDIDRELKEFTYMVGTYADHTLYSDNISFKLEKFIEHQQPAVFQIKRCSIFNILRRNFQT